MGLEEELIKRVRLDNAEEHTNTIAKQNNRL